MMDLNLIVIISCVFFASVFSLLFINKFFRRKTFEEIVAEKKALSDRIYAQNKVATKKPKKQQPTKKELKREKKQRLKEQQKDTTEEQEDSDAQSDQQSADDEPGLSKSHVEFDPDPEVITPTTTAEIVRRASIAERELLGIGVGAHSKQKSKKDKKGAGKTGILLNKNEPVVVRENLVIDEPMNNFEAKPPKDIVELKKQEREKKEEKSQIQHNSKKEKTAKKEKHVAEKPAIEQPVEPVVAHVATHVAKELKQQEDKARHSSPKNHQNASNAANTNASNSNKSKQQTKKQNKETAATKELVLALDKLSETDTIGVSLLMNLFRRAELNRSEIQLLIDYLLNKQQDMPSTHSEWSDDICQKLKRQLEEKERALAEEQESSIGIQAKLRELRTEINNERAQMNATIKAYTEKMQSKEQEITGLNQEMQSLNDKIALERQQFQAKLLREKQSGSQDLLAQLQRMQNELALKDKCIAELTCMMNSSRQTVEELQQQIRALEQQRAELEQVSNNRIFELEKVKTLETENAESKVEIRNLQNALESTKADLTQMRKDFEVLLACNAELGDKQKEYALLQTKNDELQKQLAGISSKTEEQCKEQTGLQAALEALQQHLAEKEQQLAEFNAKNAALLQQLSSVEATAQQHTHQQQELQELVDALKADVANKHRQLQEVEESAQQFSRREKELQQQLHEQKEKNDDLRRKSWKLVEALQNAETVRKNKPLSSENASLVQQEQLFAASQKSSAPTSTTATATNTTAITADKEEQHVREIFQRLYPDAVKACAASALSASFEQWVENVLTTQLKLASKQLSQPNAASSSNKSTQSNSNPSPSSNNNNHNSTHNSHNDNNNVLNSEATNNSNSRVNSSPSSSSSSSSGGGAGYNTVEVHKLHTENVHLRAKIDELTKLVTKTSNTLSDLEGRAREQDENWRSIVRSKDEQIYMLQHSNGEQDI